MIPLCLKVVLSLPLSMSVGQNKKPHTPRFGLPVAEGNHKLWTLFRILFKCVYGHCKYIKRFVKTLIQTEREQCIHL